MSTPVPPAGGAAGPPAQFEFDDRQDRVIAGLTRDMRWVAVSLMVIGVIYGLSWFAAVARALARPEGFVGAALLGLATLFYLALGVWTRRAADAFGRIPRTAGRDIDHLMAALENLRKGYALLSLLVKIYVVVIVIRGVAAIVAGLAGTFKS